MERKAISLLSGGLDSVLATKMIIEQGIEVVGLHFSSPFTSRRERASGFQALRAARELGIRTILMEKGEEYIEVVRHPRYGYGKNMNPCIDCRVFMLKMAAKMMAEEAASFVITGEVLGQRPMSQRRDTINLIEKQSGLAGLIVRPLSAAHFPPSIPEREGIVKREALLDIAGRSRAVQYNLVAEYKLKEFGSPGGGCLLTDQFFSKRLKDLFLKDPDFTMKDVELLRIGRHFRLDDTSKLILGRDKGENEMLYELWSVPYILLSPSGFKGPLGIFKGRLTDENLRIAANLIAHYAKANSSAIYLEINNGSLERHVAEIYYIDPNRFII